MGVQMKLKKRRLLGPRWEDNLVFNEKTGDFRYSSVLMNGDNSREILILEGNRKEYNQEVRNRARKLVYRLTDSLNECGIV